MIAPQRTLVISGWLALGLAMIVALAAQASLAPSYGLWHDELYSIWASDPTISLGESWNRLAGDSNPPLYFILLRLGRIVTEDAHAIFLAINMAAMAVAAAFVVWTSWRAQRPALGLFGAAAYLASGPSFYFLQDGRTYSFCMSMAFALAWQAALIVTRPDTPRRLGWIAAFSAAGTFAHVYGGLFAGAIGAGLVAWSVLGKRRDLLAPGLVAGGVAVALTAAWLAVAFGRLDNVAFLDFNAYVLRDAAWYVRSMTIGPALLILPLAGVVALAAFDRISRPLLVILAIAAILFITLPILVSLKTPIIMGRYWMVGAPLLIVALMFLIHDSLKRRKLTGRVSALAAIAVLIGGTLNGYPRAQQQMAMDGDWNGARIVASLASVCPAGSIHGQHVADMPALFEIASGLPADRFVAPAPESTPLNPADAPCPVLAWAEYGDPSSAGRDGSDEALLARMRIDAAPGEVEIIRTNNGFVIVRADALAVATGALQR